MGLVGFGQPDDGVIQMCYVVPDIRAAMNTWIDKLKVGPWFLLDHFTGTNPKYRGRDSAAEIWSLGLVTDSRPPKATSPASVTDRPR